MLMSIRRLAIAVAVVAAMNAAFADDAHEAKQDELDAQCEAAREAEIAPERAAAVEDCVRDKQKEDRAACERFYRDYGERSGHRPALYYDLPECVAAMQFRQGDSP
jgi:hypothetical protein